MNRRDWLIGSSLALGAAAMTSRLRASTGTTRKVLFFTRSAGFEHSTVRREGDQLAFAEKLMTEIGPSHGYEFTCTKDGRVFDEDLGKWDALFFYTTGDLTQSSGDKQPPMSADAKKKFLDAIAAGKPFLGSHCASDTFHSAGEARQEQKTPDPYIAMLGGEFISHGPQQEARQIVSSPKFPGAEKLGEGFALNEEWYSLKNFADDLHVILVQDTKGMTGGDYARPDYPATWARKHGDGRVFFTSMGHREDVWTNPIFQGLLFGGLNWACGEVDADITPNLSEVTPEARTMPA